MGVVMKKISDLIRGTLRLEAFGAFSENLLNCAGLNGIEIWNSEKTGDNTVSFEIYEVNYQTVKKLAEDCACELSVSEHRGGSSGRSFVRRRGALFISAFIFAGLMVFSSLFIWQIEIQGNRKLSRGEILRALDDCGVCTGTYWPGVSADSVRSRMMQLLPDIGWMTINVNGSRAVVLITERIPVPEIYRQSDSADIVAAKSGIVRRVSVLAGKAETAPGQAVTEGELLVSGRLDSITNGLRNVRSRASVMAETWYEINAVCPEKEEGKEACGVSRSRIALVFGKSRINFYISSGKAIDGCDKIISEYTIGREGLFALPLRIVKETFSPYKTREQVISGGDEMAEKLMSALDGRVEGQILQSSFTENRADGLYVLTLRAHCLENIAEMREITD